jgi:uncharacterized membrane protein
MTMLHILLLDFLSLLMAFLFFPVDVSNTLAFFSFFFLDMSGLSGLYFVWNFEKIKQQLCIRMYMQQRWRCRPKQIINGTERLIKTKEENSRPPHIAAVPSGLAS